MITSLLPITTNLVVNLMPLYWVQNKCFDQIIKDRNEVKK